MPSDPSGGIALSSQSIGVNVFNDGIQFHVSNRKAAPLLKVPDGYVVAAVVNAAAQRL